MTSGPIAEYFGNSDTAEYFIVQRSILQAMPANWQRQFVCMARDLSHAWPNDAPFEFSVTAVDDSGAAVVDPYKDASREVRL